MKHNTLMVDPVTIGLILVLVLGGALFALPKVGVGVSPNSLYIAESTYLGALDAGITYRHLCLGTTSARSVLPASCKSTLSKIIAADKTAGKLYVAVKGHETNIDEVTGNAFISAADALKALVGG